jgi:hypothetical protein
MASDESGWRKDHNRPEWIVAVELQESELSPSCRSRVGCSFLGDEVVRAGVRAFLGRVTAVAWIFLRLFHFRKGLGRPRRSSLPSFG